MLPQAAADFYRGQQRRAVLTMGLTRREWSRMGSDFDRSWAQIGPRLVLLSASAQLGAARAAATYVPAVLDETNQPDKPDADLNPRAFAGTAADGRTLDGLLVGAVTTAKDAVGSGQSPAAALAAGGRWLDMAVQTLVADAGRQATGVAIASRPRMGWVRMVNPPCCSRCAILAGKFFRYNQGFRRHPRCDCTHIPSMENVAGDFTTDPQALLARGQITDLKRSELRAIEDGADLNQVVNSRRGSSGLGGMTTTEGTTRRGVAGGRLNGAARLTPEGVYARASSREEALDLLYRNGYLLKPAPRRVLATAAQPVAETAEKAAARLIERATAAEPILTERVTTLAARFEGEAVGLDFRLKGASSLTRKIQGDVAAGEGTAAEIAAKMFDVNRYTIRYGGDYARSVQSTLDALRAEGYTLKVKNYWTNTQNPYQGVNVQIVSPDGGQWELQFHTPKSLEIKEGEMHTIYEASRVETDPKKVAEYTAQSFVASAKIPVPAGIESVG